MPSPRSFCRGGRSQQAPCLRFQLKAGAPAELQGADRRSFTRPLMARRSRSHRRRWRSSASSRQSLPYDARGVSRTTPKTSCQERPPYAKPWLQHDALQPREGLGVGGTGGMRAEVLHEGKERVLDPCLGEKEALLRERQGFHRSHLKQSRRPEGAVARN